jgi:hypothetical protein
MTLDILVIMVGGKFGKMVKAVAGAETNRESLWRLKEPAAAQGGGLERQRPDQSPVREKKVLS